MYMCLGLLPPGASKRSSQALKLLVDPLMKAAARAISNRTFSTADDWNAKNVVDLMETPIELAGLGKNWK